MSFITNVADKAKQYARKAALATALTVGATAQTGCRSTYSDLTETPEGLASYQSYQHAAFGESLEGTVNRADSALKGTVSSTPMGDLPNTDGLSKAQIDSLKGYRAFAANANSMLAGSYHELALEFAKNYDANIIGAHLGLSKDEIEQMNESPNSFFTQKYKTVFENAAKARGDLTDLLATSTYEDMAKQAKSLDSVRATLEHDPAYAKRDDLVKFMNDADNNTLQLERAYQLRRIMLVGEGKLAEAMPVERMIAKLHELRTGETLEAIGAKYDKVMIKYDGEFVTIQEARNQLQRYAEKKASQKDDNWVDDLMQGDGDKGYVPFVRAIATAQIIGNINSNGQLGQSLLAQQAIQSVMDTKTDIAYKAGMFVLRAAPIGADILSQILQTEYVLMDNHPSQKDDATTLEQILHTVDTKMKFDGGYAGSPDHIGDKESVVVYMLKNGLIVLKYGSIIYSLGSHMGSHGGSDGSSSGSDGHSATAAGGETGGNGVNPLPAGK